MYAVRCVRYTLLSISIYWTTFERLDTTNPSQESKGATLQRSNVRYTLLTVAVSVWFERLSIPSKFWFSTVTTWSTVHDTGTALQECAGPCAWWIQYIRHNYLHTATYFRTRTFCTVYCTGVNFSYTSIVLYSIMQQELLCGTTCTVLVYTALPPLR